MTQIAEIDNWEFGWRKSERRHDIVHFFRIPPSEFRLPPYISPLSRFDHHGKLTPPSIVNVLPVM